MSETEYNHDYILRRIRDNVPKAGHRNPFPVVDTNGLYLQDFADTTWLMDLDCRVPILGHGNEMIQHSIRAQADRMAYADPEQYIVPLQVEYPAHLVATFEKATGRRDHRALVLNSLPEAYQRAVSLAEGGLTADTTVGLLNASSQHLEIDSVTLWGDFDRIENLILRYGVTTIIASLASPYGHSIDLDVLEQVHQYAADKGISVIYDETASGFGRVGSFVAQADPLFHAREPFLTILGPSGGGGLPYAALVGNAGAFTMLSQRADVFAENPIVMAAAEAVLSQLDDFVYVNVRERGAQLKRELAQVVESHDWLYSHNGVGLLQTLTVDPDAAKRLVEHGREQGLLLKHQGDVVFLLPPITVTEEQITSIADALYETCHAVGVERA